MKLKIIFKQHSKVSVLGVALSRAFPCYDEGHRGTQVLIENEIVYLMGSPNYQIFEWRAGVQKVRNYGGITLNIMVCGAFSTLPADQWLVIFAPN